MGANFLAYPLYTTHNDSIVISNNDKQYAYYNDIVLLFCFSFESRIYENTGAKE